MSKPSWPQQLQTALTQAAQTQNNPQPRVALVGIGHELNGDDAAGLAVVRALLPLAEGRDRVSLIDAGPAPENCTGPLRAFAPDLVLLIDAAQMGEEPGTARWLAWQDTTGISATTHTLPPYMLAKFLTADLGCDVALLGLQPFSNQPDTPLSPGMQALVETVVEDLRAILSTI